MLYGDAQPKHLFYNSRNVRVYNLLFKLRYFFKNVLYICKFYKLMKISFIQGQIVP